MTKLIKVLKKVYDKTTENFLGCILLENGVPLEVKSTDLLQYKGRLYNAIVVKTRDGGAYIRRKENHKEIVTEYRNKNKVDNKLLYHGTREESFTPKYGLGRKDNDYGVGLYTTENLELAKEWSKGYDMESVPGYVYELKLDNLSSFKILDLNKRGIEMWLAVLYKNRDIGGLSRLLKDRRQKYIDKYYVDTTKYDVIIGYRADDSYFKYAKDYLNVAITKDVLKNAMYLGDLGNQMVLVSKKAFDNLRIIEKHLVNGSYSDKFKTRDIEAKKTYKRIQEVSDVTGVTILDDLR